MKYYISADIEGVGGMAHFESGSAGQFDYPEARAWMTNEVVAACEGARAAGCDEVIVSDSHFNGRNILPDRLPSFVRLVRCWPRPRLMMEGVDQAGIVAAGFVGYHVGASAVEGLAPHTVSGGLFADILLDGQSISETHISALGAGEFGVPVVMASGDDAYIRHARDVLGDIETVQTKVAISHTAAITESPEVCCDRIREATCAALKRRGDFAPLGGQWPATLDLLIKGTRRAEGFAMLPIFERINGYTLRAKVHSATELTRLITYLLQFDD